MAKIAIMGFGTVGSGVLEVCRRIVAPDSLFQVLILFLNGHDTTPPLLPAASSRRRDR